MRINKRFRTMIIGLLAVMMLLPAQAFAQGKIDMTKDVTLTITYKSGETKLNGAKFDLYKVADMDTYGYYTVEPEFAEYPVEKDAMKNLDVLKEFSNEEWKSLAVTLTGYARRDGIVPACSGNTDNEGKLVLASSSNAMGAGMYLVAGNAHEQGSYIYTAEPFLVALPAMNNTNNGWDYEIDVVPKFESIVDAPIDRAVQKKWVNNGYNSRQPKQITVELLKDGKVEDSVILNDANSWSHTWVDLDPHATWNVVEKDVPSAYTVSISRTGITFLITNTTTGGGNNHNDPDPKKPPTERITDHDIPLSDGGPLDVLGVIDDMQIPLAVLPATGTTWWLVGILACAGVLLFGTGFYKNRRYGDYEKK